VLASAAPIPVRADADTVKDVPQLEQLELKAASDKVRDFLAALKSESDSKKIDAAYEAVAKTFEKIAKDKKVATLEVYPDLLSQIVRSSAEFKKVGTPDGRLSPWKREETASGKTIKNEYHLWLPRKYDANQAWPLILCLPGAKQSGQAYFEAAYGKHEGFKTDFIFACPTLLESNFKAEKGQPAVEPSWFAQPGLWQLLALTLKDVLETYNIDLNRIYIDGYDAGGEAAFRIGSSFLDLFAGVVARSAAPPGDVYLANLKHVPVYNVVGTKDKAAAAATNAAAQAKSLGLEQYLLSSPEGSGARGHFESENDKIYEWLKDKVRPLYPKEIEIFANERRYGRAHWLQINSMEIGPEYRAWVKASYDRANNRITVTSENVYSFNILLNDQIIDMDKPFEVVTNGTQKFTGKKERSLRSALERVHSSGDSMRIFLNSVEISTK
jgi:poly(3-hydroxybutyrate) depolymerase